MVDIRKNGIVIGIVSSLEDPERLGRVRVRYPNWEDKESDWARLVSPMAGKERGMFFRPEVGDEVLVAFELADPRRPYIVGSLWSKMDKPPADDGKVTENNWRFIRSRSGHLVKLDDTVGKEKIELEDKAAAIRVVIDSAEKKVRIECDNGDVEVTASKGVTVKAQSVKIEAATIEVKGDSSLKVEAPQIAMKASGKMDIDGGGVLTLKGGMIKIN